MNLFFKSIIKCIERKLAYGIIINEENTFYKLYNELIMNINASFIYLLLIKYYLIIDTNFNIKKTINNIKIYFLIFLMV